jgi:hypothetical protein
MDTRFIETLRQHLSLAVRHRMNLEQHGDFTQSTNIRSYCWRVRGVIQQLECSDTPTLH